MQLIAWVSACVFNIVESLYITANWLRCISRRKLNYLSMCFYDAMATNFPISKKRCAQKKYIQLILRRSLWSCQEDTIL